MFSLSCHIRSNKIRVCAIIGKNNNFTGARDTVNADFAEQHFFCSCNENIPRADNNVNGGNCFCAVRECRDSLCAANPEDSFDSENCCGGEHIAMNVSIFVRRRNEDDIFYAGNLCRNNIHQHGGRIRCLPSRNINANSFYRKISLPKVGGELLLYPP